MTSPLSPFEHPFLTRLPDVAAGVLSFASETRAAGDPGLPKPDVTSAGEEKIETLEEASPPRPSAPRPPGAPAPPSSSAAASGRAMASAAGERQVPPPSTQREAFERFRGRVEEVFGAFESRAKELGNSEEDVGLAKYALAAFLDETILGSTWSIRDAWAEEPLTLKYFNDTAAGEEFYEKLNEIQSADDPKKLEVLEVYYLCLALGFSGKYGDVRGMAKLRGIITTLAKKLQGGAAAKPPEIAPDWMPADRGPGITTTISTWVIAVGCLALLLVLYISLAAILGHRAGSLVEAMRGH